jgi:hypothetical protein
VSERETNANDANPGLHELFEGLTTAGLDGMTPAQLKELLAIVEASPYGVRISDGRLVLAAERS